MNANVFSHSHHFDRSVNCLVIFGYIWGEMTFLKELVKFMEIENLEDLMLF